MKEEKNKLIVEINDFNVECEIRNIDNKIQLLIPLGKEFTKNIKPIVKIKIIWKWEKEE